MEVAGPRVRRVMNGANHVAEKGCNLREIRPDPRDRTSRRLLRQKLGVILAEKSVRLGQHPWNVRQIERVGLKPGVAGQVQLSGKSRESSITRHAAAHIEASNRNHSVDRKFADVGVSFRP